MWENVGRSSLVRATSVPRISRLPPQSGMILLALPLEIWEIIFSFLVGQDLQLISKVVSPAPPSIPSLASSRHLIQVPKLRNILAIARRSAYRLEVYRAGWVDTSPPGSLSSLKGEELLRAYRARWENLHWARVTRFPRKPMRVQHLTENMLAYLTMDTEPAELTTQCLRPPCDETPGNLRSCRLGFEDNLKVFSMCLGKNLFAALEEWFVHG